MPTSNDYKELILQSKNIINSINDKMLELQKELNKIQMVYADLSIEYLRKVEEENTEKNKDILNKY